MLWRFKKKNIFYTLHWEKEKRTDGGTDYLKINVLVYLSKVHTFICIQYIFVYAFNLENQQTIVFELLSVNAVHSMLCRMWFQFLLFSLMRHSLSVFLTNFNCFSSWCSTNWDESPILAINWLNSHCQMFNCFIQNWMLHGRR